ncbi:MAG: hypothetical protein M1837_005690 [Sclerophora amabilis]|nr:MAG: hypothetical protein M1837_005690 [Sclerophora amabilis]
MNGLPKFSELPLNKDDPPHSAWGLYGKDDELGTLNRQTDEIVLAAKNEIKTGTRISLNWPLDAQNAPFFGRQAFHKVVVRKLPRTVNDDMWTFNTQSSSQWDGLRHFAYQKEKKFYNGVTSDDIHGDGATNVNGIHAWAEKGIVGRGVLLDFDSWRKANNVHYAPFETGSIPLKHLKAVAEAQGTEIRFGDILIIRSGFIAARNEKGHDELVSLSKVDPPQLSGVEQSEEVLKWIWENFSAVAGDQPSFECWPSQKDWHLHEVLLSGWGCPIGELFDLEKLAEQCKKVDRWSFFVTSEVCNVPGAVASPPNILAIF